MYLTFKRQKRKQQENDKSFQKLALKAFTKLPDDLVIQVFLYLELHDIAVIARVSKKYNKLLEDKLWKLICEKTKLGESIMKCTDVIQDSDTKKQQGNKYKMRVCSYFKYLNSPTRKRALSLRGKSVTSEIHPSQVAEAGPMLAKILQKSNHAWVQKIFPEKDPKAQLATLTWFMSSVVKYAVKFGRVWVSTYHDEKNQKRIQAVAIWQNPYSNTKINLWKMLRLGKTLNISKLKKAWRIYNAINYAETIHQKVLDQKQTPHWTLYFLMVSPEDQRKGIGASILLPILKSADSASIPLYTAIFAPTIDIIRFYKRYGFEVSLKTPESKYGPEFWSLIRPAQ